MTSPAGSDTYGTVLVIDDDDVSLELTSRALVREGFDVVTATDGESGLEIARASRPVAIFLDIVLPGISGWEVLEALKADPDLASIPVTMVTMIDEKSKGYAAGVTEYLVKPVEKKQLASVVGQFRPRKAPQSFLILEDDPTNRSILARQLRKQGRDVLEAANGEEGIRLALENPPDMILLDLMMPVMDGFGFLEALRKEKTLQSIPVVVVTAKDLSEADRSQLSGSVRKILQKGAYTRDELLREINT